MKPEIKSFLILQTGKLGDAILATPLLYGLRKILPNCSICILCSPQNEVIFKNTPPVNRIIVFRKSLSGVKQLIVEFSKTKYDYLIDTNPGSSSTAKIIRKLIRFKKSIGFVSDKSCFDVDLNNYCTGDHAVQINQSPLLYFDKYFRIDLKIPRIKIPDSAISSIEKYLSQNQIIEYAVLNVSAGKQLRELDPSSVQSILEYLLNFYEIILLYHQDSYDIKKFLMNNLNNDRLHFFSGTFMESCELVNRSIFLITPDTSLLHVAGSFNKPVAALFNNVGWNLKRFYPLSDKNEVIISNSEKIEDIPDNAILTGIRNLIGTLS